MLLLDAKPKKKYTIRTILGNKEIKRFLYSLGCFEDEVVCVTKRVGSNLIISVKGVRYGIDRKLAESIEID